MNFEKAFSLAKTNTDRQTIKIQMEKL